MGKKIRKWPPLWLGLNGKAHKETFWDGEKVLYVTLGGTLVEFHWSHYISVFTKFKCCDIKPQINLYNNENKR